MATLLLYSLVMNKFRRSFRKAIAFLTSYSLVMAPLSLMPASSFAEEQLTITAAPDEPEEETPLTKAGKISGEVSALLERAAYPNIPRRGASGMPSRSELAKVEQDMRELSKSILTLPSRVAAITDSAQEKIPFYEIQIFFEAASRLEGLKILMGEKVDFNSWDEKYRIDFPLKDLSQMHFVNGAGVFSDSFVRLPGHDDNLISARSKDVMIRIHLDLRQRMFSIRLLPSIIDDYERLVYLNRMNTKASLMFAGHFAAHRLVDSMTATHFLLRQSPETTPEIPTYWRDQFTSMKIAREESILTQKNKALKVLKPELLEILQDAYADLENQGTALVLDDPFIREIRTAIKWEDGADPDMLKINYDETNSWIEALTAMISLWNLDNVQNDTRNVVYEAKRLSLRWMILGTESWTKRMDPGSRAVVEAMLDQKAQTFTDAFMANPKLQPELKAMALWGQTRAREKVRREFQQKLVDASIKLRDFATNDINLAALMAAHGADFKKLTESTGSPFLDIALETLRKAPDYQMGYFQYKLLLYNMLRPYQLPKDLPKKLTLKYLMDHESEIRFNQESLETSIPKKYADALEMESGRQMRKQDLYAMLEVARYLKFDKYEALEDSKTKATPETLGLSKGFLGIGSERNNYFNEFKKNIINNAPVLGAQVEARNVDPYTGISDDPTPSLAVWEYLAAGHLNSQQAFDLVETEMRKIPARITNNLGALQTAFEKVEAGNDHTLANVTEEMRVLVARTTQINFILSAFAGFNQLNDEIRAELLEPGFWGREWKSFNDWSNNVMNYMLGLMVFQFVGSKVKALADITTATASFLTPIFGPNFARMNNAVLAILGISASSALAHGFYIEPMRAAILKRYFECNPGEYDGAGGACVALFSDYAKQSELGQASRNEFYTQVGLVGGIVLGFWAARKLWVQAKRVVPKATQMMLRADTRTLGLEGKELTAEAISEGKIAGIKLARQQADPLIREIAEVYVRQAEARTQVLIHKEAARWVEVDEIFAPRLKELGISPRYAKNQAVVKHALDNVKADFKAGKITMSQFQTRRGTILEWFQEMEPTWRRIEANKKLLDPFFQKVWDVASKSNKAEVTGALEAYSPRVSAEFMAEIEKNYVTTKTSRYYESLVNNLIERAKKNPATFQQDMHNLKAKLSLELAK